VEATLKKGKCSAAEGNLQNIVKYIVSAEYRVAPKRKPETFALSGAANANNINKKIENC
jgi:hypothetical protein